MPDPRCRAHVRTRPRLPALLLAGTLLAGCGLHRPADDAGADSVAMAIAAARYDAQLQDVLQRQLAQLPELQPLAPGLLQQWRETLPWQDAEPLLRARFSELYSPAQRAALQQGLATPDGLLLAGFANGVDAEVNRVLMQQLQARQGVLEQHLQMVRNAQAAGRSGELSAEEDFIAVRAQAEAGDAAAQLLLAEKLLGALGTPRDVPAAFAWLEKSAAQEHAPAQDLLASLHYRGLGTPVDYRRARDLLERAAARNYVTAVNNLAWLLATCPDASLRDGARAIALLQPLLDQSAEMLDTLAAAHAEDGRFAEALRLQRQAVNRLDNMANPRLPGYLDRLQAYAAGRPWRDPATPPR